MPRPLAFLFVAALAWASSTSAVRAGDATAFSAAAVESLRVAVAAEVEQIRGHDFERPVPVRVVDADTLRAYVLARIDEHLPPDRVRNEGDVYADLGLLPPDLDVLEFMLELLEEQVAGFYDPAEKVVFLLDHSPWEAAPVFLAHELTHALDDQLFDLDGALAASALDSDRSVAGAGAREGAGSAVMTVFMTRWSMAGKLDLDAFHRLMQLEDESKSGLRDAPPVLVRSLLAPYVLGQDFVLRGTPQRMWRENLAADLDTVLTRLPASTEQLLHPQKYWSSEAYDSPVRVGLPSLADIAGAGWTFAGEGTLGELDLACLTGDCPVPSSANAPGWTHRAAEGWGGDRWQLLRNGEATVTVLALVWDAEEDADEFERAVRLPDASLVRSKGRRTVVVAGEAGANAAALLAATLAGMTTDARR